MWLEPGFYFQGPAPPEGPWRREDWFEVPHAHYLPISKSELLRGLGRGASDELRHLMATVDALIHLEHHRTLDGLKADYDVLSPRGPRSDAVDLEATALRFSKNFIQVLQKANFIPYREDFHRRAKAEQYLLDVPVEVDWTRHDPRPIQSLFEKYPELKDQLKLPEEFKNGALIFYRGIEPTRIEGRFVMEKVDRLVAKVVRALTFPIVRPVEKLLTPKSAAEVEVAPELPAGPTTVFEKRWLLRKSFANQPLLRQLFSVTHLQEPAMRQVVAMFHLLPPVQRGFLGRLRGGVPRRSERSLLIKLFRDVPLADSEILFPEKKLRMKPFDLAVLVVSAIAAVPALYEAIVANSRAALVAAALIVAYGVKIVTQYLRARRAYVAKVTEELYKKSQDNDVGVLQYLVDALEEQELKESLLAYSVLLAADEPMTESALDAAVERYVHENFGGIEFDFEVDDALAQLQRPALRLVVRGGDTYRAVPPPDAQRTVMASIQALVVERHDLI